MAMRLGSGNLLFEPVEGWEKLPEVWYFRCFRKFRRIR